MKKNITFLLLFIPGYLLAQEMHGFILPKSTFSNHTCDTLIYISKQKVEMLIDREKLNKELITTYENRVELCDSALQLKTKESENWYKKLLETDEQLKNKEIENARKARRGRIKSRLLFGTGVVLGVLVRGIL